MKRELFKVLSIIIVFTMTISSMMTSEVVAATDEHIWYVQGVEDVDEDEVFLKIAENVNLLSMWTKAQEYMLHEGSNNNEFRVNELEVVGGYNDLKLNVNPISAVYDLSYETGVIHSLSPAEAIMSAMTSYHDNDYGNDVIGIEGFHLLAPWITRDTAKTNKLQEDYVEEWVDISYLPEVNPGEEMNVYWYWDENENDYLAAYPFFLMTGRNLFRDVLMLYDFKVQDIDEVFTPEFEIDQVVKVINEGEGEEEEGEEGEGEEEEEEEEEDVVQGIVCRRGSDSQSSTITVSNPNLEVIEITKEYSYSNSKEISHEKGSSVQIASETSIEAGLELSIPVIEGAKGTIKATQTFSLGAEANWKDGIAYSYDENISDAISVPLPSHTSIVINESYGTQEIEIPYTAGSKVTYKTAMFRLNGFDDRVLGYINDGRWLIGKGSLEQRQIYPLAIFGQSNSDAHKDLLSRIGKSSEIKDRDKIEWEYMDTTLQESFSEQSAPYLPTDGKFIYTITGTTITPEKIQPMYNLDRVVPTIDEVEMYIDEYYNLDSIDLEAFNMYDVAYYGFKQRTDGEWRVVDSNRNPDESIGSIEDGLNSRIFVPKQTGLTYLQYMTKDMPDVESDATGMTINSIGSYLIPVYIESVLLSNVVLDGYIEPLYFNGSSNIVPLDELELTALDSEGNVTSPSALLFKLDEDNGAIIDNDGEKVVVSAPGTYHIYAIANGEESNRVALTVYPERKVESFEVTGEIPELEWYDMDKRSIDLTDVLVIEAKDQYGDNYEIMESDYDWLVGSTNSDEVKSRVIGNELIALTDGLDTLTLRVDGIQGTPIVFTNKEQPYLNALSISGEIPDLVWNDQDKYSVDLTDVIDIYSIDQYGSKYPLEDSDLVWRVDSTMSSDVKSSISGNILTGMVVGSDNVTLSVGELTSNPLTFKVKASPYMNELKYEGNAAMIEPDKGYDLSQIDLYAIDQYGSRLELTEDEMAAIQWEVKSESEIGALISDGVLTLTEEVLPGVMSTLTLSATLDGEVKTCTVGEIVLTVKAPPVLNRLVITTPVGLELKLNENANLSTFDLTGYDQYGDAFDIDPDEAIWTSSDPSVIEVTDLGTIVGKQIDQPIILTASIDGVISDEFSMMIYGVRAYAQLLITNVPDRVDTRATLTTSDYELSSYDQYGRSVPIDTLEGNLVWSLNSGTTEATLVDGVINVGDLPGTIVLSAWIEDNNGLVINNVTTSVEIAVERKLTSINLKSLDTSVKVNKSLDLDTVIVEYLDQHGDGMTLTDLSGQLQWTLDAGSTAAKITGNVLEYGSSTGKISLTAAVINPVSGIRINDISTSVKITISKSSSGGSTGGSTSSASTITIIDEEVALSGEFEIFEGSWDDVLESYWAYDAIMALSELGMVDGRTDVLYEPELEVTRAEFAAYMVNVMNLYDAEATENFEDVADADKYAQHIASAYGAGLIKGSSDKEFKPNDPIKRQEIVSIMIRAWAMKGDLSTLRWEDPEFLDFDTIDAYAQDAVKASVELGLIKGYVVPNGKEFRPQKAMTRAEASSVLHRFYEMYMK